ncbi:MAG: tetratricopeptide repeat protein [Armatimonadota bacterium]
MNYRVLLALLTALVIGGGAAGGWWLLRRGSAPPTPASYLAGTTSLEAGDLRTAESELRRCIAENPAYAAAYAQLGNLYLLQRRLPQAVQALETAIAQGSSRPEDYTRLAQAYLDSRRTEEAYWAVAQALKTAPADTYALAVRGELLLRDDNLAGSLECFRAALRQTPGFSLAYLKAGYILLKLQKLEEAEQLLKEGLEHDPHNPGLHLQLAESYFARPQLPGAADLAEKHYQLAIPNNPGAASAHKRLAELAVRRGDHRQARQHFMRALELQPGQEEALYGLAQLERRSGNPREASTYLRRAQAEREAARRFGALKARAQARPDDVDLAYKVAREALEKGRLTDAERLVERAARRHPDNREIRRLRASLYLKQGRADEARAEFEIASTLL